MNDQPINQNNDDPSSPPSSGKGVKGLSILLSLLGLFVGIVVGGFMGGVYYKVTRGGGGSFAELKNAADIVMTGGVFRAIGGTIGGYVIGLILSKNKTP